MKKFFKIGFVIGCCILYFSCSKSNEEQQQNPNTGGTTPTPTCDTVNMRYSVDVLPILQSNCYTCHSAANFAVSGFNLENFSTLKAFADNGTLIGVITHASGYPAMPKGAAQLSDCNINKIRDWIQRGALNN